MLIFLTAVGVVLVVSFLCSIFESVLLSLTRPQIEVLGRRHERAARLLAGFKENMFLIPPRCGSSRSSLRLPFCC